MELKVVGVGNTATVYDYEDGKVLKLFKEGYPKSYIEHEYSNSQLLNEFNFNKINSYGMILYKEQHGIIYDKVEGITLLEWLLYNRDDITEETITEKCKIAGTILANEHAKILNNNTNDFMDIGKRLGRDITRSYLLEDKQKKVLLDIASTLPSGNNLCHGDFHTGNIMVGDNNYVIDYMNISKGHPHYDIARTVYLTELTPLPKELEEFRKPRMDIIDTYLEEMSRFREEVITRYVLKNWLVVIAASRLTEINDEVERSELKDYLIGMGID